MFEEFKLVTIVSMHTNMNLNISKHIRNSKKVIDLMRSMIRLN